MGILDKFNNKNTVKGDQFDTMTWKHIDKDYTELHNIQEDAKDDLPTVGHLFEDTFRAMFKSNPELHGDEEIDPSFMVNKVILERLMKSTEFLQTKAMTELNKINAAVAGRNLEEDFYELFMKEITVGIGKSGVKAGLLKVATGDPEISDYEKTVIKAAVRAAKETGVPIITHTDGGTVGLRQQELFLSLRADSRKIMIGHQNNTADNDYHLAQLQNPHFYIGFDRMSVTPPTGVSPAAAEESLIALLKRGYADRIMLSHDYIANWLGRPMTPPASVGWADWYPTYIFKK